MHERRKNARWKLNKPARLRLEGAMADTACVIQDINFYGVRICLKPRLPRDTFLKLKIILSRETVLDVEAWQVWHKTLNSHNIYGLYFSKISDADKEKIYKFVYKLAPQSIAAAVQPEIRIPKSIGRFGVHYYSHLGLSDGQVSTYCGGGAKMEDRRIFARFSAQFPVRYLDTRTGTQGKAQTQDISAKGLGLASNQELTARTPLEIWLEIPDQGEPLYTRGQVVWSRKVEPNLWRSGVSLEKADLMGLSRVMRAG